MKTYLAALVLLGTTTLHAQPPATPEKPPTSTGSAPEKEKFLEPYAPKPTAEPPAGWKITLLKNSKVENKTELSPGKEISISVQAYQLTPIPKAGEKIWVISEPKYNPLLKNAQEGTLGAAITQYSEEAEDLAKTLHSAIDALENSLKNAPIPENKKEDGEAAITPSPTPTPKPTPEVKPTAPKSSTSKKK